MGDDVPIIWCNYETLYLCCKSSQQVYQIDLDGKFVRKIGQMGRAANDTIRTQRRQKEFPN